MCQSLRGKDNSETGIPCPPLRGQVCEVWQHLVGGAWGVLNEASRTLFRGADITTGRNVNPVLYGDTFLTEGT